MVRKRFVSIVFVVVALLFSAWGNVIAAAFCPRFSLNRDCCLDHVTHQTNQAKPESSCHHEMGGMEMGDLQDMQMEAAPNLQNSHVQPTSESSSEDIAVDQPIEACTHCVSHSQTTSGAVSFVGLDPSKGLVETDSPPASTSIRWTLAFTNVIVPSEHGPPAPSSPRHLIINVFRI